MKMKGNKLLFTLFLLVLLFAEDNPSIQALNSYEKQYEVMMNNVVNANTPGYRSSVVVATNEGGELKTEVFTQANKSGALIFSNDPLHVAIEGPGFYMVQGPEGKIYYTRDGRFTIDESNQLVTLAEGYPVLGEGGVITLPLAEVGISKVTITERGQILVKQNPVDRLIVGEITDYTKLKPLNGTFFFIEEGNEGTVFVPMQNFKVRQYYYEASNVDVAKELVNMPNISKKFDANSKALQIMKKIRAAGREMGNPQ